MFRIKFKDFPFKRKVNLQTHDAVKKHQRQQNKRKTSSLFYYFMTAYYKTKKLFSHLNKNRLSTADITVGCYRVL